jgi:hypothetical protein
LEQRLRGGQSVLLPCVGGTSHRIVSVVHGCGKAQKESRECAADQEKRLWPSA